MTVETATKINWYWDRVARIAPLTAIMLSFGGGLANSRFIYSCIMVLLIPSCVQAFVMVGLRNRCPLRRFAVCVNENDRRGMWKYAIICAVSLMFGAAISCLIYLPLVLGAIRK